MHICVQYVYTVHSMFKYLYNIYIIRNTCRKNRKWLTKQARAFRVNLKKFIFWFYYKCYPTTPFAKFPQINLQQGKGST